MPVVEPIPLEAREFRFVVPLLAQEASYFAASAKIGCTSDAHEAADHYGDDRRYRSDYASIDGARPDEVLAFLWRRTAESRVGEARGPQTGSVSTMRPPLAPSTRPASQLAGMNSTSESSRPRTAISM